jgi:hypothetical protein
MRYLKPNIKIIILTIFLLFPILVIFYGVINSLNINFFNDNGGLLFLISCIISYLLSSLLFYLIHKFKVIVTDNNYLSSKADAVTKSSIDYYLILIAFIVLIFVLLAPFNQDTKGGQIGYGYLFLLIISILIITIRSFRK